jgi:acyl-CoA reductase-like NAD-dependent aldehyde dehydrogenase
MPSPPAARARSAASKFNRASAKRPAPRRERVRRCLAREGRASREELAQLAPENAEYVEFLGAQEYLNPTAFLRQHGEHRSGVPRDKAGTSIKLCKEKKLEAAVSFSMTPGLLRSRIRAG